MSVSQMKTISVLIPAYNASETIRETLDSVLSQTRPADEILVMDDGSTDDTRAILDSYGSRLKVFSQRNQGVAESRNVLCHHASGDVIAFIDSDDIWHPSYLEMQSRLANEYPKAAATFIGHFDFRSGDKVSWDLPDDFRNAKVKVFSPRDFLTQYTRMPGNFFSSFSGIRRAALRQLGDRPFRFRQAEDFYFFTRLLLTGSMVFHPAKMGGYRRRPGSLSSHRILVAETTTQALEALESEYRNTALEKDFRHLFAMKRRAYAKVLLHFEDIGEARRQLKKAIMTDTQIEGKLRAFIILCSAYFPTQLRPDWLAKYPEWKSR
jgi:glycosyltransferase involved in cell wall biosynthesis